MSEREITVESWNQVLKYLSRVDIRNDVAKGQKVIVEKIGNKFNVKIRSLSFYSLLCEKGKRISDESDDEENT